MIFQAGFSWSSNSLLMFWCRLIPWLRSFLCWCSGAIMVMPLFYQTIHCYWFIEFYTTISHSGYLSDASSYIILFHDPSCWCRQSCTCMAFSELLWTQDVLNCPENAVYHVWWETYIVCISCHMNILLVCLYGFCTCDGRAVLTVFYLVGCFMVSSCGIESCVTAWKSTHSPWKPWAEPVWCVALLHPRCLHSVLMLGWCCISGSDCCVV